MLNLIWILNLFKSCWRLNDIVAQSSLVPKKKSKSRRQAQLVQKQKNKTKCSGVFCSHDSSKCQVDIWFKTILFSIALQKRWYFMLCHSIRSEESPCFSSILLGVVLCCEWFKRKMKWASATIAAAAAAANDFLTYATHTEANAHKQRYTLCVLGTRISRFQ